MRKLILTGLLSLAAFSLPSQARPEPEPSILDVALSVNEASGEFSTLIAAVLTVGLEGPLDANRHFTVFAPTDAAFAALGLDASNIATALSADEIRSILLYHLSPGDRFAADIVAANRVRMINKGFTFPSVSTEGVRVNDALVLTPDIDCRNGVIHVIDSVLLP